MPNKARRHACAARHVTRSHSGGPCSGVDVHHRHRNEDILGDADDSRLAERRQTLLLPSRFSKLGNSADGAYRP